MRIIRALLIVVLIGIAAIIVYAGWGKTGPNQFEAALNPGGTVVMDLAAGGYLVRGTPENKVRVEVDSGDNRNLRCVVTGEGTNVKVEVDGKPDNFHATIYVPERSNLQIDQTIGDLLISNVEGNKNVSLGIGRLRLEVPANAPLPTFDGTVMIGGLRSGSWHVEKGGFFRNYYSSSSAPYSIKAQVDIGDLETIAVSPVVVSQPQQAGDTDKDVTDEDSQN